MTNKVRHMTALRNRRTARREDLCLGLTGDFELNVSVAAELHQTGREHVAALTRLRKSLLHEKACPVPAISRLLSVSHFLKCNQDERK